MAYTTRNNKIRVAIVTLVGTVMAYTTRNNKIQVAIVTLGGTVCDGIHNEE